MLLSRPYPNIGIDIIEKISMLADKHKEVLKNIDEYGSISDISSDVLKSFYEVSPLYHGETMLMDFGLNAKTGMKAKFILRDIDEKLRHPFYGLKTGLISGQRLKIVVSHNDVTKDEDGYEEIQKVLYHGEAILNTWDDNPRDGMVITVRLDEMIETKIHPFHGLMSGNKSGTILWFSCWALTDDEMASPPEIAKKTARPWRTLDTTTQSNIKCSDVTFQNWIKEHFVFLLSQVNDDFEDLKHEKDMKKLSAETIRRYCGIVSRREFKYDNEVGIYARQQWLNMMNMYEDWMRYGK